MHVSSSSMSRSKAEGTRFLARDWGRTEGGREGRREGGREGGRRRRVNGKERDG